MERRNVTTVLATFLVLASLIFSSCAREEVGEQVQPPTTKETSLIVIDRSGNALPIVFRFYREENGVKCYLGMDGKELTRQDVLRNLKPEGMIIEEVGEIWGTSITEVFALFSPVQLSERSSPGAASNAALIYDMWKSLTSGPSYVRDNPRGLLGGILSNRDMSHKLFDFIEQRKHQAMATGG